MWVFSCTFIPHSDFDVSTALIQKWGWGIQLYVCLDVNGLFNVIAL